MTQTTFYWVSLAWMAVAVVTFAMLFFKTAPYGRHTQGGWGPLINNRLGWILMEAPSALLFFGFWACSGADSLTALCLLFLWELHYVHRAFIYPFRLPNPHRMMPASISLMGASFNLVNASLNGYWVFHLSTQYSDEWLTRPLFLLGAGIFLLGMSINHHADEILLSLRRPGDTDYRIPRGGLYEQVSCPNYLGEIIEWVGWSLATWSISGLTFAVWTVANLVPRALSHHRWYQEKFSEYPSERRAIFPFLC